MKCIDLNCDMGEIPEAIFDGTQESLMPYLTSASIACGGHAGDARTMKATIEQALRWKLAVGAHPGYPDRENFGRVNLNLPRETIADSVFEQVRVLAEIAAGCGARRDVCQAARSALQSGCNESQSWPKRLPMGSLAGVGTSYSWAWLDRRCWMSFKKLASVLPRKLLRTGGTRPMEVCARGNLRTR